MKSKLVPKRRLRYAIAGDGLGLVYMLLLGGCTSFGNVMSGSSQGQAGLLNNGDQSDNNNTISGRVINGYLANALVFQDINSDGLLSNGEPLTITGIDGTYSLAAKTGNIVVKPINYLTADEKINATTKFNELGLYNPDLATTYYVNSSGGIVNFTGQMKLLSPKGSSNLNVTPLSTMVAGLVNSGIYDDQRAEQKVIEIFGVSSQTDYIALSKSVDPVASNLGIESQNRAVSFSNLIATALDFYRNDISAGDVLKSLAVLTTENLDEASENSLVVPDWTKMLSSSSDVKRILSKIAVENKLQIDLGELDKAADNLASQNKILASVSPISLEEDTGISAIDGVTSNPKVVIAPNIQMSEGGMLFSVAPGKVMYENVLASLVWVSSLSELTFTEGVNTLFARSASALDQKIYQLSFLMDTHAPGVSASEDLALFDQYQSDYFLSDGKNYANNLLLNDSFLNSYVVGDEHIFWEYQVVEENGDGGFAIPTEIRWTSFINISPTGQYDGLSLRTYFQVSDLAGNTSNPKFSDIILDNVAPVSLLADSIELKKDSGIYSYDRYSNSIVLDQLTTLVANDYQDATTKIIQQWTQSGMPVDENAYLLNPPIPVQDGEYTFWVKQIDRAGNASEAVAVYIVLDTTAPILPSELEFDSSEWSRGLVVNALDFNASLTEWEQYKIVSKNSGSDPSSSWSNTSLIDKTGDYDIYYRIVDRAGNVSAEELLGTVRADFTAPIIEYSSSLNFTEENQFQEYLSSISDQERIRGHEVYSLDLSRRASGIHLVHEWVASKDPSGNVSIPLEFNFVIDEVARNFVELEMVNSPWINGKDGGDNLFNLSRQLGESYNLVGAQGSDRANNLMPGDIFLGLEGVDYGLFDTSQAIYGLSFLTQSELDFIYGSAGINLNDLTAPPIFKIYSEDRSNPDEGGMSIIQAEWLEYKDAIGKSQLLMLERFTKLETWVINLGDGDDQLYFGGETIAVNGGSGADHLQGGGGEDYLIGGSGSVGGVDLLQGYAGNDLLVGGDYLFKSDSHYRLEGGSGDDTLIAGNGHGDLIGGDGHDFFWIDLVDGSVAPLVLSIMDFNPDEDKIGFLNWDVSDAYKGVFIDPLKGSVSIDLVEMIGATYGSVLNITGFDSSGLLPEFVVENWINSYSSSDFAWTDLSIDTFTI
jgi:Ca2+-binding RTX toxin-like protein